MFAHVGDMEGVGRKPGEASEECADSADLTLHLTAHQLVYEQLFGLPDLGYNGSLDIGHG